MQPAECAAAWRSACAAFLRSDSGQRVRGLCFEGNFCRSYGFFTLRYGQRRQNCQGRDIPATVARSGTPDGVDSTPAC